MTPILQPIGPIREFWGKIDFLVKQMHLFTKFSKQNSVAISPPPKMTHFGFLVIIEGQINLLCIIYYNFQTNHNSIMECCEGEYCNSQTKHPELVKPLKGDARKRQKSVIHCVSKCQFKVVSKCQLKKSTEEVKISRKKRSKCAFFFAFMPYFLHFCLFCMNFEIQHVKNF